MSLISSINESALITEQVNVIVQQFVDLGFDPEEVVTIQDFMEGVTTLEAVSAAMGRAEEMDWVNNIPSKNPKQQTQKRQTIDTEPMNDKDLEPKAGPSSVPQKGHNIISPSGKRLEIIKHFQGVVTFKGPKGDGRIKASSLIPAKADREGNTTIWAVKKA